MRILIFGGAFDPPHLGHLQLLKEALKLEFFDEIWLIPTFVPPLKMRNGRNDSVAGPEERLTMCKLLINDLQHQCHAEFSSASSFGVILKQVQNDKKAYFQYDGKVKVLDLEIKRGGKSYTIETVRALKKLYPKDQFFFLIGSDWVKNLGKWHKIEELYKKVEFIVLPRTEISSSAIRGKIKKGESISGLVTEEIESYIKEHNLYIK